MPNCLSFFYSKKTRYDEKKADTLRICLFENKEPNRLTSFLFFPKKKVRKKENAVPDEFETKR